MIGLSVLLAGLAALLFAGPSPGRSMTARLVVPEEGLEVARIGPARSRWRRWAMVAAAVAWVWVAHDRFGAEGVAVALAVLIVVGTAGRLSVQSRRSRAALRARTDVAQACSVLASQIRVGRVPTEALAGAVEDCPVLADASRVQQLGGDVTAVWRAGSREPGQAGLADLARAWQVSMRTGAPLAPSLEQVSQALTADLALRTLVAGELSAPRATGKIMAVLPFCGLGMGYLLGGDPIQFLLSSPYGWVCLVAGVGLAAAGVLWIDRLAVQASEQE
ncbi:MAG: hypothetical protein ABWX96_18290 [Propionibacteriaceae bacterium]